MSGIAIHRNNFQRGMSMLVLTRKSEEKIVIGKENQIIITILKIQGDKVSIGIEAAKEIPVCRLELLQKDLKRSNEKSLIAQQKPSTKDIVKNLQTQIKNNQNTEEKENSLRLNEEQVVELTRDP
jgi:carbon storage regulator